MAPKVEASSSSREQRQGHRSGALIALKPGSSRNLFFVHDGDGDPLSYLALAQRMPDDLAVFAIAPRSMPRVPLAHTRIEDMAAFYINEVRRRQPHGPYLLAGHCAGGVIAYEMAVQLSRAGEPVELVALLDAATAQAPRRRRRITLRRSDSLTVANGARNRRRLAIAQAYVVSIDVARKLANALASKIIWHRQQCWVRARFHLLHHVLARHLPWPRYVPELLPLQICESAWARYTPKPLLNTSVVLVRARRRGIVECDTPYSALYDDETLGWGAITEGLDLVDVDGGHATMLQAPFVDALATALLLRLRREPEIIRSYAVARGSALIPVRPS